MAILTGCKGGDVQIEPKRGTSTAAATATLVSIAITPVNPSSANGSSQQFIAIGTFSDNTTRDLTTRVTWNSSDTSVATIGSTGLASSIAAGSTTITAASGSISESTTLAVVTAAVSATLSWDAPTTNTDGTPLTGLAGYNVYYGTSSKSYTSVLDVGNVTTYTVANLPPGTYYFAVTSYDASRVESDYSNEASKTIQ